MVTTSRDDTLAEVRIWHCRFDTFGQLTARLWVGSDAGGGGTFSKFHLEYHQPPLFTRNLKLETVNLFLHNMEHWVRQWLAAMGTMELDKRIDFAWRFLKPEVYSWFTCCICQPGVMDIPPADGSYAPVMWLLVKSMFL